MNRNKVSFHQTGKLDVCHPWVAKSVGINDTKAYEKWRDLPDKTIEHCTGTKDGVYKTNLTMGQITDSAISAHRFFLKILGFFSTSDSEVPQIMLPFDMRTNITTGKKQKINVVRYNSGFDKCSSWVGKAAHTGQSVTSLTSW